MTKVQLIRIVRMTFKQENLATFLAVFESHKHKIRSFEGCHHLELWQDYEQENILTTYSHWESDEALDQYRQSELFKEVWAQTKIHFDDKPIAYSFRKKMVIS